MIEPNRQGEVWVFAQQEDGQLHDVVLELCGKARELADRLNVDVGAVLPGTGVESLAAPLIAHGADVNGTSEGRITSLHDAAENGHYNVAELLIANGAEVDAIELLPVLTEKVQASKSG